MVFIDRLRDKLTGRMTVRILGRRSRYPEVTEAEFEDFCFKRPYTVRLLVYPGTHPSENRTYGVDEWIMALHGSRCEYFKQFLVDQGRYARRLRRNNLLLTRRNLWRWLK